MKRHPCFLFAAAVTVWLAIGPSVRADLFSPGATLDVTYEDPSTGIRYTQTVPFNPNGTAMILEHGLSISEQTLVVSPTKEWVQFDLTTTNGGPLTFYNEYFDVNFNNVNLTQTAGWIGNYLAFTLNGKTSGDPFFYPLFPDPINPSVGDVAGNFYTELMSSPFHGNVFFPNPPAAYYMFATPVGAFLSSWGTDPNVNGFLAGVELQADQPFSTVPEPSTLALGTAGLFSLAIGGWRRRKRVA